MTTSLLKSLTKTCLRHINVPFKQIRTKGTYKAALIKSNGKELVIEDKHRHDLKDDQVRVQVHYCSVNADDLFTFRNHSKDSIPGYELTGEVIEIGKKITNDQVMLGEKVAALSLRNYGGFAEECVLNIEDVFRLPSNLQLKEAAVVMSGHSLAMLAFSRLCMVNKDDYVVVTAGQAGHGLAAVDVVANVYGAKVVGVTDSNERADLLREKGAFNTVQYSSKLSKHILEATDKKGASVVYDAVGGEMLDYVNTCLTCGGRIFLASAQNSKTVPAPPLNTNLLILSLLDVRERDVDLYRCIVNDTLELADQGVISGIVAAKFDFIDVNRAVKHIEENKSTGKVLIKILN